MNNRLQNTNELLENIKKLEPDFLQLIRKRIGIVIHVNQTGDLCNTLFDICQQLNYQPRQYLEELATCSAHSPLLENLVAGITIGESYFFRDQHQMLLLQNNLLPRLIQEKKAQNDLTLRIWSAGCSSGEEIYTLAMILTEIISPYETWHLHLLGTDINSFVLQKAMLGIYSPWSMRAIQHYHLQKYFSKTEKSYLLKADIRNMVRFSYLNLNEESYPSMLNGTYALDLILCRNVLLYFDDAHITPIMQRLSSSLAPHGYLLLGASDPIIITDTAFTLHHDEAIYLSLMENTSYAP